MSFINCGEINIIIFNKVARHFDQQKQDQNLEYPKITRKLPT